MVGTFSFLQPVVANNSLTVSGFATFDSGLYAYNLVVDSSVTMGDNLSVSGLAVTNNADISNLLTVSGLNVSQSTLLNTLTVSGIATFLGDVIIAGQLVLSGASLNSETQASYSLVDIEVPTSVGDYVEFATIVAATGGSYLANVSVSVSDPGFSMTKKYVIPFQWNTAPDRKVALPIFSTGDWNATNDFELLVENNGGSTNLRLRKTLGSGAGYAGVNVILEYDSSHKPIFTAVNNTGTDATAYGIYKYTPLTQDGNTGYVGLGTDVPLGKLDIYNAGTNSDNPTIYLRNDASAIRMIPHDGKNYIQSGANTSADSRADLVFSSMNAGANFMTIKGSDGSVGIGVTDPIKPLDVNGDLVVRSFYQGEGHGIYFRAIDFDNFTITANAYNCSILLQDHNLDTYADGISINGYDGVSISTGSNSRNERMRVAQNGNVGIGTTNPTFKLHVNASSNAGILLESDGNANLNFSTPQSSGAIQMKGWNGDPNDNAMDFYNGSSGAGTLPAYYFRTASSGKVFNILNNGNVGIGITNPTSLLQVSGTARINGSATFAALVSVSGLSVSQNSVLNGTLIVSGNSTFGQLVSVSGLSVSNNFSMNGGLVVSGNSTFGQNISVSGLTVSQNSVLNGALRVSGSATLGSSVSVSGLSVSNNTIMSGSLNVASSATFGSTVSISDLLVTQNSVMNGTLSVSNNATFGQNVSISNLSVSQNSIMSGTLLVSGAATMSSSLSVSGLSVSQNASVGGTLLVVSSVTMGDSLNVSGLSVSQNSLLNGSLTVGANATFNANLSVSQDAYILGKVYTDSIQSVGTILDIGGNASTVNVACSPNVQTVNIGSNGSTGVTTINIGGAGDIINIAGSMNYISTTNLAVTDKTILLNKDAVGSGTARGAGLNIRDSDNDTQGYIIVSATGDNYLLKAPESGFVLSTPILTQDDTFYTKTEVDNLFTTAHIDTLNVSGNATFATHVSMESTLTVASNATFSDLVTISGLHVINNTILDGTLLVALNSTFGDLLSASGLYISHSAEVADQLSVSGLTVSQSATIADQLSVSGLSVSQSATISDQLSVSGISVSQSVSIADLLSVSGISVSQSVTIADQLSVSGLIVSQSASIYGSLTVADSLSVSGLSVSQNATISGTLMVVSGASFMGDVTIAGQLILSGASINSETQANYSLASVTLPTTVNDYISFAQFDSTSGSYLVNMNISVSDNNFSLSKKYVVPVQYYGLGPTTYVVQPMFTSGNWNNSSDIELLVLHDLGKTVFSIRRTLGSQAGTAGVNIVVEYDDTDKPVFTSLSDTGSDATAYTNFPNTPMTLDGKNGYVGIGTAAPTTQLEIIGGMNASGRILTKNRYTMLDSNNPDFNGAVWNFDNYQDQFRIYRESPIEQNGALYASLDATNGLVVAGNGKFNDILVVKNDANNSAAGFNASLGYLSIEAYDISDVQNKRNIALAGWGGNVGIGITNPTSKLQVVGTSRFTDSATFGALVAMSGLFVSNNGTVNGTLRVSGSSTFGQLVAASGLFISNNANIAGRVVVTGGASFLNDVTIGGQLYLSGGLSLLQLNIPNSSTFGNNLSVSGLWVSQNATIRNNLLVSSGSVGIGITNPTAKLDVAGTGNFWALQTNGGNGYLNSTYDQILLAYNDGGGYRHSIKSRHRGDGQTGNAIDFFVWDQSVDASGAVGTKHSLTIDNGKLGVGQGNTGPIAVLDVSGTARVSAAATFAQIVSVSGLFVSYNTVINGSLSVSNGTTFGNNVSISGLFVSQSAIINGRLSVGAAATFASSLAASALSVSQLSTLTNLLVNSAATFNSGLWLSGVLGISQATLYVSGDTVRTKWNGVDNKIGVPNKSINTGTITNSLLSTGVGYVIHTGAYYVPTGFAGDVRIDYKYGFIVTGLNEVGTSLNVTFNTTVFRGTNSLTFGANVSGISNSNNLANGGVDLGATTVTGTFPPIAGSITYTDIAGVIQGANSTISGQASYYNGVYELKASSNNNIVGRLVDKVTNTTSTHWEPGNFYDWYNYGYVGGITTTVNGLGSVAGEWFQIKYPIAITPTSYSFYNGWASESAVQVWTLVGSNDGSSWDVVHNTTDYGSNGIYQGRTYSVSVGTAYTYYRFIIRGINDFNNQLPRVAEFELVGSVTTQGAGTSFTVEDGGAYKYASGITDTVYDSTQNLSLSKYVTVTDTVFDYISVTAGTTYYYNIGAINDTTNSSVSINGSFPRHLIVTRLS